jgi:hypothetical protein
LGVPCRTCGRTYDVALFQFGRTIHCTCGSRVALEPRAEPPTGELRLFADAMLGRLARWLRILGYDTAYEAHISDEDLARRCFLEGRVLVTRDRRLGEQWRVPRVVLLRAEAPLEQLRELFERLGLERPGALFRRCPLCNALVEPLARASVRGLVPERVRRERERFVRCPRCRRVYWEGSHTQRMRTRLATLLGNALSQGGD